MASPMPQLMPVEHDPFGEHALLPVEHDPFAEIEQLKAMVGELKALSQKLDASQLSMVAEMQRVSEALAAVVQAVRSPRTVQLNRDAAGKAQSATSIIGG